MTRPRLFLDVDGVLNPLGTIADLPVGFALHDVRIAPDPAWVSRGDRGRELTIALNPAHGAWLRSLATDPLMGMEAHVERLRRFARLLRGESVDPDEGGPSRD